MEALIISYFPWLYVPLELLLIWAVFTPKLKFYVPEISTVEQIVSEEEKTSSDVFNEVLKNNPDPTAT